MKVSELVEQLKNLPQDKEVVYCENGAVDGLVFILGAEKTTCSGRELSVDLPEEDIEVVSLIS